MISTKEITFLDLLFQNFRRCAAPEHPACGGVLPLRGNPPDLLPTPQVITLGAFGAQVITCLPHPPTPGGVHVRRGHPNVMT